MTDDDLDFVTNATAEVVTASKEGEDGAVQALVLSVYRRCGYPGWFAMVWILAGLIDKLSPPGAAAVFVTIRELADPADSTPRWCERFIRVRARGGNAACGRMFGDHPELMLRRLHCLAGMAGGAVAAAESAGTTGQ